MRARSLVAAFAAASALVPLAAPPAGATGTTPLVFTDQSGDANAANGQGASNPALDGTRGPAQLVGFDILSVTLDTDAAGTGATTLVVTLELDAPPQPYGAYRVRSYVGGACFRVEADYSPSGLAPTSFVRHCDDTGLGYSLYDVPSAVTGNAIVWSVPLASFAFAGVAPGVTMTSLDAETRLSGGVLTAPVVDAASTGSTYTIGQ